jgi:uncharacterized glyoxalase superfamily protein PhnB
MAPKKKTPSPAAGVAGIDHLYVATKDFDAAWTFWTRVVGGSAVTTWGEGDHKAGIVSLGQGGGVVVAQESGGTSGLGYEIVHGRLQLFVKVAAIDKVYAQMRTRGAKLAAELHKTHWGPRAFSIHGPDGLIVAFIEQA